MAKRAARGQGSIRERKDGRWEARYTSGRNPSTGKQIQKCIYGKSQADVLEKLIAIKAGINNGTYTEPSNLTIEQWLDIWVAEYLDDVKPNTQSTYKAACNVHLKPSFRMVKLSELDTHSIQTMYNRLKRTNKLSPKYIRNIHGAFHKALEQAVTLKYISVNPANNIKLPKIIKKEIVPLNDDSIKEFLTAIQNHRWSTLYMVTLFSGMRQGEILGLQWNQINFDKGIIKIDKQLIKNRETKEYEIATVKNEKIRKITPAKSVMYALFEQRSIQAQWRHNVGDAWEESNLVFTNELGKHLSPSTVYQNYKRLVAKIDLSALRFHDLRHSYAVASLRSGDDIKTLQENLGHHSAAFTLDVYGHVTDDMKKESAERMEEYIKKFG